MRNFFLFDIFECFIFFERWVIDIFPVVFQVYDALGTFFAFEWLLEAEMNFLFQESDVQAVSRTIASTLGSFLQNRRLYTLDFRLLMEMNKCVALLRYEV